jgi:hypothetical protein
MMSSTKLAHEILDALLDRIEECLMLQDHDEYLEIVIDRILHTDAENINHKNFNQIITSMYRQITIQERKTECTPDEAFREISWMLETYYKGNETFGYDGALYDAASNGREGLIMVLARILEVIVSVTRTNRITYLVCASVDPLDWHLRKALVKEILDRFDTLLKPDLRELPPSQLVPYLEDLIIMLSQPNLKEKKKSQPTPN